MASKHIALLTDFGTEDGYVAAMKGRILSLSPQVNIVDISHHISPYDIYQAAFCLNNCYLYFPEKTIFVVVVDPGVGTDRPGIVIKTSHHYFVGPDNGVFSFILEQEAHQTYQIEYAHLDWEVSPTFHGRDVFVPMACLIANDRPIDPYVQNVSQAKTFLTSPKKVSDNTFQLNILMIDHFGNIILNFHQKDWRKLGYPENIGVKVKNHEIKKIQATFGVVPPGEFVLTWDSSGYLQIAQNQGNAAKTLQITRDEIIQLYLW
ncbi:MAG: hypothetical protein D6748_13700 [Calditrichaeota bacterium]|nr:MAG: hypothetical protein D6748_13700 [Calditrichota bacterium]